MVTAAAAATALCAVATTGCAVRPNGKEAHATRTFPHSGTQLTITSSGGGLRILPGTAGAVRVDRWSRGKAAAEGNASWSLEDGTLRLSADCAIVFGDCAARYRVRVPPGVRLVVHGSDDGVVLRDLAQDVNVSSAGPIRAYGTSGRLRLLGDDSLIAGDHLRSPTADVRTSTGPINLSFATPPSRLNIRSRDGRVTAIVPPGPYQVTATSTHGRARSQLKSTGSDRTIVVRSTSGDVRIKEK